MEAKEEGVHFSQQNEKEAVTFKVRFAQFKQTVGPKEGVAGGSCLKWFNIILSIILLASAAVVFSDIAALFGYHILSFKHVEFSEFLKCSRILLFGQAVGLACLVMGIICHAVYYEPFKYIASAYVNVITIFIISGIVMIAAGALGIFCIAKKSYSSLMACLIILAVLIILHFILGGLAFSYRSRADRLTKKAMTEGFAMYYANDQAKEFMDWSQNKFKCCGSKGPEDYPVRTHSSTKAPQPTSHHGSTTKKTSTATTRTVPPTTQGNTTTTVVPESTTQAPNTTVASTTVAKSSTKAPSTTLPPPTTTTAAPKLTTTATTTKLPSTTAAETSTKAKTTIQIIQGVAGQNFLQGKSGLPESCCKETKSPEPCSSRSHDLYKHGCYTGVDAYVKKIMCAIGAISFVMIGFELLHLITGALCSKTIKEESGYFKV